MSALWHDYLTNDARSASFPFYGLSPVFTVKSAPAPTGASFTSSPDDAALGYGTGETIRVRIAFDEPVNVTSAADPPSVWLRVGDGVRRAWYVSGSGTANLEFTYTVQRADLDSDGVSLCSDTSLHRACGRISYNGGTIGATVDSAGADARYPTQADQSGHKVDGSVRAPGVSIRSAPSNAAAGYAAGDTITLRVSFSEPVDVTGMPHVVLNVGGAARRAVYAGGTGTANLDFAYTVQASDFDADGLSLCSSTLFDPGCGRIQLDGGSILARFDDLAAPLALPAQGPQSGHKVDGTPPGTFMPAFGAVGGRPPTRGWASCRPAGRSSRTPSAAAKCSASCSSPRPSATPPRRTSASTTASSRAPPATGHAAIRAYSAGFRVLASTEAVDARDNTATTGTGVPIYWLDGNKLADDYADLYDGELGRRGQPDQRRQRGGGPDPSGPDRLTTARRPSIP